MFSFQKKKEKYDLSKTTKVVMKDLSNSRLLEALEPENDVFVKILASTEILRRMNEKKRLLDED